MEEVTEWASLYPKRKLLHGATELNNNDLELPSYVEGKVQITDITERYKPG